MQNLPSTRQGSASATNLSLVGTLLLVLLSFSAVPAKQINVAMMDLLAQGALDSSSVQSISDRLRNELFNTNKFSVLERNQMSSVLEEQGFQQRGCVSNACAVEAGQLLGVNFMIVGSIGLVGSTYTINVRMIDVGTGKITHTASSDCKCEIDNVLSQSTVAIAKKLARAVNYTPSNEKTVPERPLSSNPDKQTPSNPVSKKVSALATKIVETYEAKSASTSPLPIAIVEFDALGKTAESKKIGRIVSELMGDRLLASGKFTLIERMRLRNVLREMELGQTGLIDAGSAVSVGKMAGAKAILCGSVSEAGAFFILHARLIDAEKGTVLLSESVDLEREGMIALSSRLIVTKKYPAVASFRSLLVPGWGQFYNDAPKRGYLYPIIMLGAAGGSAAMHIRSKSLYDDYQKQPSTSDAMKLYDDAQGATDIRDGLFWGAVSIWAISVIDAYFGALFDLEGEPADGHVADEAMKMEIVADRTGEGVALNLVFPLRKGVP